jgi:hypothetical protein
MNTPTPTSHTLKAKTLAVAIILCFAGSAHSPRVEATGIPTFDASNLMQMFMDFGNEAIKSCFSVNSMKEAVQRVQDIQKMVQRTRVTMGMSELMPERDLMEGIEACPGGGGGLAGSAASLVRGALGMGNTRLDGSTDLRALQTQLCATEVILTNQKWNAEREQLNEMQQQAKDYEGMLGRWNSLADAKGQIEAICNITPGGGNMSVAGGAASEGKQATFQQEIAQVAADNARALEEAQAKVQFLDGAIVSVRRKQAEVGQMMMSGERGSILSAAASATVRTALLKTALENAKSD